MKSSNEATALEIAMEALKMCVLLDRSPTPKRNEVINGETPEEGRRFATPRQIAMETLSQLEAQK